MNSITGVPLYLYLLSHIDVFKYSCSDLNIFSFRKATFEWIKDTDFFFHGVTRHLSVLDWWHGCKPSFAQIGRHKVYESVSSSFRFMAPLISEWLNTECVHYAWGVEHYRRVHCEFQKDLSTTPTPWTDSEGGMWLISRALSITYCLRIRYIHGLN